MVPWLVGEYCVIGKMTVSTPTCRIYVINRIISPYYHLHFFNAQKQRNDQQQHQYLLPSQHVAWSIKRYCEIVLLPNQDLESFLPAFLIIFMKKFSNWKNKKNIHWNKKNNSKNCYWHMIRNIRWSNTCPPCRLEICQKQQIQYASLEKSFSLSSSLWTSYPKRPRIRKSKIHCPSIQRIKTCRKR